MTEIRCQLYAYTTYISGYWKFQMLDFCCTDCTRWYLSFLRLLMHSPPYCKMKWQLCKTFAGNSTGRIYIVRPVAVMNDMASYMVNLNE
jgi:hypothetical protein